MHREKSQVTYVTARKITGINQVGVGARGGDDFLFAIFYVGIIFDLFSYVMKTYVSVLMYQKTVFFV